MKVKCIKGTTKLVKGSIYEVARLNNLATGYNNIYLVGFGNYTPKNFTQLDGSPLPQITWVRQQPVDTTMLKPELINVGDILVCKSEQYVHFTKGSKYKVAEIQKVARPNYGTVLTGTVYYKYKIKFEGYNRFIEPNAWSFRMLAIDESRDLSLNSMFGEEVDLSVDVKTRKLDTVVDKNKTLIETLAKAICDRNRHDLSVIEWASQKSSRNLKVKPEDYKDLMNLTLEEILKMID